MLFGVLGTVAVLDAEGETSHVTAARQRALLALLTLHAGRFVTRDALVEGIWGDAQPRHADAALQVVKSRLVAALGRAGDRIVADSAGYRLDVGVEETDVGRAEYLLRRGREALAVNEAANAIDALHAALDLFRGNPLEDVAEFPFAAAGERRLRELHVAIYEARNDALLTDGRHLDVLADIDDWVAKEPLREHLRAQQMTAYYRAGRQAEALRSAAMLRKVLRDELGVEPSPALQQLERRVLDQDPGLLPSNAGIVPPLPPWTSEALPFIGREKEWEAIVDGMLDACGSGVHLCLVSGAAGSGKSRFLLEAARRIGSDCIVVAVDVHHALRPALLALRDALSDAAARMPLDERRLLLTDIESPDSHDPARWPVGETRFRAASWLAGASAKAPVLLLVDDLDRAGPGLVSVMSQLVSLETPKRVLVLGSISAHNAAHSPALGRMAEALEAEGHAHVIELRPLARDDIDDLLARMVVAPRDRIVDKLLELSGGNPLLLAELLQTGPLERISEIWPTAPRVRDVVSTRVDELGRAGVEVLEWAAIYGFDFTVDRLASVSGITRAVVATVIERAVAARILTASSAHEFRFEHDVVRRTLAEGARHEPGKAHRVIASALEADGALSAGLAWHWARAEGEDAAEKTLHHARLAGDTAMQVFDPRAAVRWYELALSKAIDERTRGELLVALAEAKLHLGDTDFESLLHEAAGIARRLDDDDLFIRLVDAATPVAAVLPTFSSEETQEILERVIAVAPNDATRSRALACLGADHYVRDSVFGRTMLDRAIALARASNDDGALLHALLRRSSMDTTVSTLAARERDIAEALPLAVRTGDLSAQFQTHALRVVTAMQRGNLADVIDSSDAAARLAATYDLTYMRWSVENRRAWRAGLAGDAVEAERLIRATRALGRTRGVPFADENAAMQFALLRWQQGEAGRVIEAPARMLDSVSHVPGFELSRARSLAAHPERHDEARECIEEAVRSNFASLADTGFWSSVLVFTAETVLILDLPDAARAIYDLLLPYADQVAFSGNWVAGPIAYGAAVASSVAQSSDTDELFELAIAMSERIEAPLLRARAQLAWVRVLQRRGSAAELRHAADLCDDADLRCGAIGCDRIASWARMTRAALG